MLTKGLPILALSSRGRAILTIIAVPISQGFSQTEIARALGRSDDWIRERLNELQDELQRLARE